MITNILKKNGNLVLRHFIPGHSNRPSKRTRRPGRFALCPRVEGLEFREAPSALGLPMATYAATASMSITITVTNEDDFDFDEELIEPIAGPEESTELDPVDDSSAENDMIEFSEDYSCMI